jgi:hypothetical protein
MNLRKFVGWSVFCGSLLVKPWGNWLRAQGSDNKRLAPTLGLIPEPHFPARLHLFV